MRVFIGSSRERLKEVRLIAAWLEAAGCTPMPWDQPGLFMPGDYLFSRLRELAMQVDAAVLVFGQDDQLWYRGDRVSTPRDNVLIEYGLFAGQLSPKRAVICRVGATRVPSDLDGLVYAEMSDGRVETARLELDTWARQIRAGLEVTGMATPQEKPAAVPGSASILLQREMRLITASDPESSLSGPSNFLRGEAGGISLWVNLPAFGTGIRLLENNRYLVAHATHGGRQPYRNVFSLSRGPTKFDPPTGPLWRLWLANGEPRDRLWTVPDDGSLTEGWHNFVIRWNHGRPVLELLVDGKTMISASDYREFWPSEYADKVLIGTWPQRWQGFYANTTFWRPQLLMAWPDQKWITVENEQQPPPAPTA